MHIVKLFTFYIWMDGWMASFNITITTIAFCCLMFDRHSKNVPNL